GACGALLWLAWVGGSALGGPRYGRSVPAVLRPLLPAIMCALFLSTTAPLPIHAADGVDDLPDIAAVLPLLTDDLAAEVPVPTPVVVPTEAPTAVPTAAPTPEPTPAPTTAAVVRVAAPRPANAFVYGTHISALDHAATAHQDGFRLMWGYVPWQQVEPNRGDFLFRKQDKWGKPLPNALTNVINAAAQADMKIILRLDEVPGWAGGNPAHLDPNDLEQYLYETVRYGKGTIQYVEIFNEPNLPYEWGGAPDPAAYARLLAAAYRGVKRADQNVSVIAAAVAQKTGARGGSMEDADFIRGLYAAGGRDSFDVLGMHAYLGNFSPETDPNTCSPMCFRDVERFRGVMDSNGDAGKPAF